MLTRRILTSVILLFALSLPLSCYAQQSRLRQSMTHLSSQIAQKMDANHRTRIAVLEFSDLDGGTSPLGQYIAETLMTDLFDTGKFQVVERRLLATMLKENKLKTTGLLDPATTKKLGQVLGVDAIVSGTISNLASHVAVNARLVAVDTAAVFASASVEIEKDEDVKSLMKEPETSANRTATIDHPRQTTASLQSGQLRLKETPVARSYVATYTIQSIGQSATGTTIQISMRCEQQCFALSLRGREARGAPMKQLAFIIDDQGRRFDCIDDRTSYSQSNGADGQFSKLAEGEVLNLLLVFRPIEPDSSRLKVHYFDNNSLNVPVEITAELSR